MKKILFGVPSGSLQDKTIWLLTWAGIIRKYNPDNRAYQLATEIDWLVLRILDRRDMPEEIADGIVDCGITGSDYYEESEKQLQLLGDFTFSRKSDQPTRLVLAGPERVFWSIDDIRGKRISTELPILTRKKLQEVCGWWDEEINIRRTNGKTETAGINRGEPFTDIAESGETLVINNQKIFETLFVSSPTMYARPESLLDDERREKIWDVYDLLRATYNQQSNPKVMAEMNVPRSVLSVVCQMLPADVSPTILPEQNPEWVVVKVLVSSKIFTNMKGNLWRLWVRGIVETDVKSVM